MSFLRGRIAVFCAALAGCVGLAGWARAQEPTLAQMSLATWTARDGAPQGITVLAQARDGTLWVGAMGGLYQFDGHTFRAFEPPPGQPYLPPEMVRSLLVARDGALWIAFRESAVARVTPDHVTLYTTADTQRLGGVEQLREARDGSVWASSSQSKLIRFDRRDSAWHVEAVPAAAAKQRIGGLYVDSSNVLWLAQGGHLFRRQLPDTTYTMTAVPADVVFSFAETPGGDIWITDADTKADVGRTHRFDRAGKLLVSLTQARGVWSMLYTPGGSLIVTAEGVYRFRADALTGQTRLPLETATDSYGATQGLTIGASDLLLDSDHNLWVGGRHGLYRFSVPRLVPFHDGRIFSRWGVCATRDDVFVTSTASGLYGVAGGVPRLIKKSEDIQSVSCGNDGRARVLGRSDLWEVRGNRLERVPSIPGAPPFAVMQIVAMSDHSLYALTGGNAAAFGGIWQYKDARWSKLAAAGVLRNAGYAAYVDPHDRFWVGYRRGQIGRPLDGRLFSSGTPGLGNTFVFLETSRGFFAAGTNGLAVLRDTSFEMLAFADRASTRGVGGLVESRNGDLWLNAVQGIVRVPAQELAKGLANPKYPMKSERVTEGDFTGPARADVAVTSAARAADGTLWFSMLSGVVHYNPESPHANGKPPIVSIKSITADRVPLDARRAFDPQPRTLAIQYLGVNLTAPNRVRYRYKLDGFDDEWQDAGDRTEAVYTRPRPGRYTFRLMAANEAGVWTAPVASAPFTVLPSFYQTTWFMALIAAAAVALAWLAYSLRIRSITTLLQARADERADERVRIARELHDTLLGDMAGVAMQLSAGARRVETSGAAGPKAIELLSALSAQVQDTLVQARRAVTAMRMAPEGLPPIHQQLESAVRRALAGTGIAARVEHTGSPRSFDPHVESEILGICIEAISNARTHANCRTVTITCTYADPELRVRVRDDGRGFDPSQAAPVGHWGLVGMRERAASIGATLTVTSAPGAGTEVVLVAPARGALRSPKQSDAPPRG